MNIPKLLTSVLPDERIKSRIIDRLSYASDAGFYHLEPRAIAQPITEEEVQGILSVANKNQIPVTFRAAGTSLSGQAITDGILVELSKYWKGIKVEDEGRQVRVQPGVIGANVNAFLKKYAKKIGPDPASINSAMMGGILANNASGMCCGVSNNSYHTVKYIRFILPDGSVYSTENESDYQRFELVNAGLYSQLLLLRDELNTKPALREKIRAKYQTKNTLGYSLNAFIDYHHPLDIFAHLLVGSEGTLGFISEAVLNTVPDYRMKSTALLYFPTIYSACQAIVPLAQSGAEAVELMDRASLRSVENIPGIPEILKTLPEEATALLVEYQGNSIEELSEKTGAFLEVAPSLSMLTSPVFTSNPSEQAFLWQIRKGMFPAVGAIRASGSTVILEDIAFPVVRLGEAILDLQSLFKKHAYHNAIIFGHAKDGNIHFVVTQSFKDKTEVERYDRFMKDVVHLVVSKYDGALKAEHGTGRNMAPFVETEWGGELYLIMQKLKAVTDPNNILNPGVIINDDKQAHISNLKSMPAVEVEVDKCTECGFCEHKCPSRNITMTPRRRIVARRALARLKSEGRIDAFNKMLKEYQYDGLDTCAVDGLCGTACPVNINTGTLVKRLRRENHSAASNKTALIVARNFGLVSSAVRTALISGNAVNTMMGSKALLNVTKGLKKVVKAIPLWSPQLKASPAIGTLIERSKSVNKTAVYFTTCITRTMGGSSTGGKSVPEALLSVSEKAGLGLRIPNNIQSACCGQIYSSKGFDSAYRYTVNDTIEKLWRWSGEGKYPVVLDMSSCTQTIRDCRSALTEKNQKYFDEMTLLDSIDYLLDYVAPAVTITKKKTEVVLHPVCSLQKMTGMYTRFIQLAELFAKKVEVPLHAGCCGMAGDRGFLFPELTHSATLPEATEVRKKEYDGYYSSSKTCEMNLSEAIGKNYESIVYLIDDCCG